jgi:hypothetical protein
MHLSSRLNRLHGFALAFLVAHPTLATAAATDNPAPARSEGPWSLVQFAWDCGEAFGWQRIGTYLLIATVLSILLLVPFSRLIVGPERILAETTLFVGSVVVLSAAFLALAGFILPSRSIALLVGVGIIYVAVLLAQTRHIFMASRGEAASVLGCFLVVAAATLFSTEFLTGRMPWTTFLSKPRAEQSRMFTEWKTGKPVSSSDASASAATAAGPTSTPTAVANPAAAPAGPVASTPTAPSAPSGGELDLQAIYAQLQKARAELNMNDPVAVENFNVQAQAYNEEKVLAAARAARRSAPPKAEPTEKAIQAAPVAKASR